MTVIERLTIEEYVTTIKEEFEERLKSDQTLTSHDKKNLSRQHNSTISEAIEIGIIPFAYLENYIARKSKLNWKLIQVVPLFYPINKINGGANKMLGFDYYWIE